MKLRLSTPRRLMGVGAMALAVSSCGGGIVPTNSGTEQTLTCAGGCTPSNTLSANQIRASYAVVSNGQQAQAQAGFSSRTDSRFNVAIAGNDTLSLVTAQGSQSFVIPATSAEDLIPAAFSQLIAGAQDYVSNLSPTTAASPVQFQVLLSGTSYSASITLPAPYQITSPTAGFVLPMSAPILSVQLTAASVQESELSNDMELNCTWSDGSMGVSSFLEPPVAGSLSSTAAGTSYSVNLASTLKQLTSAASNPSGLTINSCSATLTVTLQSTGEGDARMASTQIIGQQIRQVSFSVR